MTNFKIEFRWSLIFMFAQLVWLYFEKAVGLHDELIAKHLIYTNLFAIVAIVIYVLALLDKKRHFFLGKMTWKQGFLTGIVISIIVAVISPLTQYITHTYISPGYFDTIIDYKVGNSTMTVENAQIYFNLKRYMLQSVFDALSIGVVTAAIVAFFLKSKHIN